MGNQSSNRSISNKSAHLESNIRNQKSKAQNKNNIPYQNSHYNFYSPQRENTYTGLPSQMKDLRSSLSGSVVENQRSSLMMYPNATAPSVSQRQYNSSIQQSQNMSKPYYPLSKLETPVVSSKLLPPIEIPQVKLVISQQLKASILHKEKTRKPNKTLVIETKTAQIDELRVELRAILKKMNQKYLPQFDIDISQMNEAIQCQRLQKLKDKNKVVFLLKQKTHYEKICNRFKDYTLRIKKLLLQFRKRDSIEQITSQQIINCQQIKVAIETLVNNIQNDLPQKGWKILVEQPGSKFYMNVVNHAVKDPEIMKMYYDLEQSLINSRPIDNPVAQNMMRSITYKVGEDLSNRTNTSNQGVAY